MTELEAVQAECEFGVGCAQEAEYRWQGKDLCAHHFPYGVDSSAAVSASAEFQRKHAHPEVNPLEQTCDVMVHEGGIPERCGAPAAAGYRHQFHHLTTRYCADHSHLIPSDRA